MWLYPVPIGIEPVLGGGACNRELPRILIPRTSMNKGEITLSALTIHRGFIATDYSARSEL
jgi:hypothetical protein